MEVDGQPIIDLLASIGVNRADTNRVTIRATTGGTVVTVREFLRNEKGQLYADGDEPASREVVGVVRWPE